MIVPKDDNSLGVTLDVHNLNKELISTSCPIPKQEDIKAQLSGSKVISKLDFKSAFCQLELQPDSCYFTVFHVNDKFYCCTCLIMGVKPAPSELNAALRPTFGHTSHVFLIHDELIIATKTTSQHKETLLKVMEAIQNANLTLNP